MYNACVLSLSLSLFHSPPGELSRAFTPRNFSKTSRSKRSAATIAISHSPFLDNTVQEEERRKKKEERWGIDRQGRSLDTSATRNGNALIKRKKKIIVNNFGRRLLAFLFIFLLFRDHSPIHSPFVSLKRFTSLFAHFLPPLSLSFVLFAVFSLDKVLRISSVESISSCSLFFSPYAATEYRSIN